MKAIGILGGVGPSAGVDLAKKVFKHTKANKDQEHINLFMTSCPALIPDRTAYLLEGGENPAPGMQKCMEILKDCGASAFGICCNTAHSPKILSQIKFPEGMQFVNLIDSTCAYISKQFGKAKVGLMATKGTTKTGIYDEYFAKYPDLELVKLDSEMIEAVHDSIYNKEYGIKAVMPVSETSRKVLENAIMQLKEKGCKAVILGCTELPLAFEGELEYAGVALVDPTDVLACCLIKAVEPEKLI